MRLVPRLEVPLSHALVEELASNSKIKLKSSANPASIIATN